MSGESRILGKVGGGGGRQNTILLNFPKNYMKSRKLWLLGGGHTGVPLDPPLGNFTGKNL